MTSLLPVVQSANWPSTSTSTSAGMEVTLLGTGDTTGTPTPGCDCATCQRARELGVQRRRFSVHVHNDRTGASLLIDFSPDFRDQFLSEDVALPDAGIVTHVHFDHASGLGNAYRLLGTAGEPASFPVYAADTTDPALEETVAETLDRRYGYLDVLDILPMTPYEPTRICGFDVTLVPVDHPPLVCFGVAIEDPETGAKLSISGDTNYAIPDRSRAVLDDPDLLLADGIVHSDFCERHPYGGDHHAPDGVPRTFGTKHMTRRGAIDLAEDLSASDLRIVHVAHYYPADRAFEEPLAVDGEQFVL